MSSHDPTLEPLLRLPRLTPDPEATARVQRCCHAVLARRAARLVRHARANQNDLRPGPLSETVVVVSMGIYLMAAIAEAVRVAGSL